MIAIGVVTGKRKSRETGRTITESRGKGISCDRRNDIIPRRIILKLGILGLESPRVSKHAVSREISL
jgi:hypothetical protein